MTVEAYAGTSLVIDTDSVHVGEKFMVTPIGLVVSGEPTFDESAAFGELLRVFDQAIQFAVGDYINFMEGTFGEQAAQVIDAETGWSESTTRVYRWVAAKVPIENRYPVSVLSFDCHQQVAALPAAEQRAWLEKAAAGDAGVSWGGARLKQEMRADAKTTTLAYGLFIEFTSVADRDIVAGEHERVGRKCRKTEYQKKAAVLAEVI